ncbi:uncharacterized protein BKA55DRAFT_678347 [Fusarium redolens]|uniref:Uncharacterized protein n=1 Tax=Fusarium redolens TaxID=48865 RepID=A0A9P9K4K0_FUSRE|nr:uncharacterized protein BKA55DRAFT_678347 [Fusarium redolens]KAH7239939.1 hypothetical protein BKA55DRAFT_678347 [Fusarium redolens]
MADPLTTTFQPNDGSIRCQVDNTFLVLSAGTFKIGDSLLVGTEDSATPSTILIYADTVEMTSLSTWASGCNIGIFCRSLNFSGPFPKAYVETVGREGLPVTAPNAPLTDDNNGQNGGNISVYIEEYDPAKLMPTDSQETGLWLNSSGGDGNGAKYGPGGGPNGVKGGNAGQIQFSYVSTESALLGKLNKIYTDASAPFRARAQQLASLVPKGTTSTVGQEANTFESNCKSLDRLITTLDHIKRTFRSLVPKDTKPLLESVSKASKDTLTHTEEPRFDLATYSNSFRALETAAKAVSRSKVQASDVPWGNLKNALLSFKTTLSQIGSDDAETQNHPASPFAIAVKALENSLRGVLSSFIDQFNCYNMSGGGEGRNMDGSDEFGQNCDIFIQAISPDSPDLSSPVAYVHPDQCQMLLDVANRTYLAASCKTGNQNPGRFDEARQLYERIFNRLSFVPLLQSDLKSKNFQPLTRAYAQMQAAQLCLDPISELAHIHLQAGLYLSNISHGKDMFGHGGDKDAGARWVPRLPYTQYSSAIISSLPKMTKLATSIAAQEGTQQDTDFNKKLAIISVQAQVDTLQKQIQLATSPTGPLKSAESQIQQYTPALKAMRFSIQDQVTTLTQEIDSSWNFNPTDIINGITQLLSNPDELVAGMGIFAGLYNSFTTVQADDSDDVNKQYVVKQFASAGDDLGKLNEAVKLTASGTYSVDDPGAAKLLADEKTLNDLIDKFSSALDPNKVKNIHETLHEFATLAKRRNAAVLKYNTTAIMLVKALQSLEYFRHKNTILSSQNLMSDTHRGSLLLFQLKTFNAMCATAYELIYEAAGSMQFWTLDSDDQVDPSLPTDGFDSANTVEQIRSYVERLSNKFTSWLSSYSENPGLIFPNPSNPPGQTAGGITWFLSQDQVSALQNTTAPDLSSSTDEQEYRIMFVLPAPTSQSTDTSGSPDYNPFTGYANVRLDQVLVWLFGATVQPDQETQQCRLSLEISHLGDDSIVRNDGSTTLKFMHSTTQLKFVYDPTNVTSWEAAQKTNPITVQNLDSGGEGAGRDSARTERELSVAPIGPFATWMLTVRERENNGLDLSKLTGVCLEFWGSAHTVDAS